MFTGLIKYQGKVKRITRKGRLRIIEVNCLELANQASKGDSVAINGACLTVTKTSKDCLFFDISEDSWQKTSFGNIRNNQSVNLEESLRAGDKIGGHFVSGHIDGTGKVKKIIKHGEELHLYIQTVKDLVGELIPNGSIAIDGVSLTIKEVGPDWFSLIIIPHTLKITTLAKIKTGSIVNIETDILGKYAKSNKSIGNFENSLGGELNVF